jgi:hypothetical protein
MRQHVKRFWSRRQTAYSSMSSLSDRQPPVYIEQARAERQGETEGHERHDIPPALYPLGRTRAHTQGIHPLGLRKPSPDTVPFEQQILPDFRASELLPAEIANRYESEDDRVDGHGQQ